MVESDGEVEFVDEEDDFEVNNKRVKVSNTTNQSTNPSPPEQPITSELVRSLVLGNSKGTHKFSKDSLDGCAEVIRTFVAGRRSEPLGSSLRLTCRGVEATKRAHEEAGKEDGEATVLEAIHLVRVLPKLLLEL